ncbi:hypothetical protein JOF55_002697 [Haloactinomyces albus]|uniref:Uncharacterized protein n=1 Tax=Haloactinomyces albus TaxID=1352928 RepID=A0AAE4CMK5_9ACTN|nr:hypothetical protein [Haloactinomyces albus]
MRDFFGGLTIVLLLPLFVLVVGVIAVVILVS